MVFNLIVKVIKILSLLAVIYTATSIFYYYYSGEGYLPRKYYEYSDEIYPDVPKNMESLNASLMSVSPVNCIESMKVPELASYIEWYLEGFGFKTYIAKSDSIGKIWIIVKLNDSDVAIDPEYFCSNSYNPSGIIDTPDQKFRNYSVTWKIYRMNSFEKNYSEFLIDYHFYYDPPKLYENPGQMIGIAHMLKYPGWSKLDKKDIDWWNSEQFKNQYPFSLWD